MKSSGSASQVVSGRVAVFEANGERNYAASNFLLRLRPKRDYDPHYLAYALGSPPIREQIADQVKTMTYPNLPYKLYKDLLLPVVPLRDQRQIANFFDAYFERKDLPELPGYLDEQRRIVARIEELAPKVEEACNLRQQAVRATAAVMDSTRRSLFGESPGADWIPLSRYVAEIENGRSPQCEPRPASDDEWGVLKVGAISFGTFDELENKALPPGMVADPRYEVHSGDFLMSRANTTDLCGACTIVGATRPRLLLSDKTFRFHFQRNAEILPQWLEHVMKSPALRDQIERGASGTSPTMKNISKEKVFGLLLPLHALPQQRRVVAYLDGLHANVEAVKRLQTEATAELDALMPSILSKAFRGEL